MKKNLISRSDTWSNIKGLRNSNRQVQKYFSLESHPRQKQENPTFIYVQSAVALMF